MHWLLISLMLFYLVFGGKIADRQVEVSISAGLFFYAALVMGFRYINAFKRETQWKLAIETLAMIAIITWVLKCAAALESPLANAYLLPVITAALTLEALITLVEVGLIAACYLYLAGGAATDKVFSLAF